ncbi:restriction endonuclease subunit S [Desulfovibrio caledoniensis]
MSKADKVNPLPQGWANATLSQLVGSDGMFVDGDWIETKDQDPDGDVRLIQLADIGDGLFIDKSARFLTSARALELNCTFLRKDDILIARMPEPLGRACLFPFRGEEDYITVVDVCVSRPHQGLINRFFIMHAINSPTIRAEIDSYKSGSTRKRISRKNLDRIKLPIAPINEQNRIVAKIEELFSELDAGVENLKKAKEQLGVYRQSLLKHAFEGKLTEDWREENADKLESGEVLLKRVKKEREEYFKKQLAQWDKDVAQWEMDGRPGKKPVKPKKPKELAPISAEELKELPELPEGWVWGRLGYMTCGVEYGTAAKSQQKGKYPVLRMGNIQESQFVYDDLVFTDDEEEYLKYKLGPGDVLFNRTNSPELVGKTAVFKADFPALFAGYLIRINQINSVTDSDYLNLFLNSHVAKKRGDSVKSDGVNQSNINGSKLVEYPFPYCCLEEQKRLSSFLLDRLSVSIESEQEMNIRIQQSEDLRKTILGKAFSGELVPQDPTDEPASKLLDRIKQERKNAPKPTRTRKPKTKKKRITMADLRTVLADAKDWVSAQDAFRQCGIADEASTDEIEKLYEKLKQHVDQKVIEVERRNNEDWLRLKAEG